MEKYYTAFIHKEEKSIYGVTFPDFPGCTAAEETRERVLRSGREALQLMIDAMFETGQAIPEPSDDFEEAREECDDVVGVALIPADIPAKRLRINVSMADHIIKRIDECASELGENRSGLLARAAQEYIASRERLRDKLSQL